MTDTRLPVTAGLPRQRVPTPRDTRRVDEEIPTEWTTRPDSEESRT
ncbi:hypothetical protein AB0D99_07950 [Streptomyces sp. NPDC047971]